MASAGSGQRGRPPEFVEDATPLGTRRGGAPERFGWLLRRCRLHLRGGRFARQRAFVESLNELGVSADASRVSRWEKSELDVPPLVVSAYEQLLGLPASTLQATARGLYRGLDPGRPSPPLFALPAGEAPHESERRALALVDLALEGEPSGGHWCELVERLTMADLVIMQRGVAERLVRRLLSEVGRSLGPAFVTRHEALRRLCAGQRFVGPALQAIDRLAHEPWSGVLLDVVTVLVEVPGGQADDLVLRLLHDENPELQQAALWAAATRVDRGSVGVLPLTRLEQALITLLGTPLTEPVRLAAHDVVVCMPPASRHRVLDAVGTGSGGRLRSRGNGGGDLSSPAVGAAAGAIARHVLSAVVDVDAEDRMLTRVLREALAHSHYDRRHQASVLLMVGPFRRAVADALIAEWANLPPQCRLHAATLLAYVADDTHIEELDRRVAAVGPQELVRRSWMARAHLLRPIDDPNLLDRLTRVDPEVAKTAVYALGMTGSPQLHQVEAAGLPESVQARCRWWLAAGAAVRV